MILQLYIFLDISKLKILSFRCCRKPCQGRPRQRQPRQATPNCFICNCIGHTYIQNPLIFTQFWIKSHLNKLDWLIPQDYVVTWADKGKEGGHKFGKMGHEFGKMGKRCLWMTPYENPVINKHINLKWKNFK